MWLTSHLGDVCKASCSATTRCRAQDMLRQNGISASEQSDMLRLDAMVMMVQLNIRNLLEVDVCLPSTTWSFNAAQEHIVSCEMHVAMPSESP